MVLAHLPFAAIAAANNGDKREIKGEMKEAAGHVKEEIHEHGKTPEAQKKAQEGRDLRNEGRVEDGKPLLSENPGNGKLE